MSFCASVPASLASATLTHNYAAELRTLAIQNPNEQNTESTDELLAAPREVLVQLLRMRLRRHLIEKENEANGVCPVCKKEVIKASSRKTATDSSTCTHEQRTYHSAVSFTTSVIYSSKCNCHALTHSFT